MTMVIAEAGVNHNGSPELALQLVSSAATSGADIVKFQTFSAAQIVTLSAQKAGYQKQNTTGGATQYEMLRALELPTECYREISDLCKALDIEFLSTAFDESSLRFLTQEVGVERLKVPSGEITNGALLLAHAKCNLPIILSTGMSRIGEIDDALRILAHGYLCPSKIKPSSEELTDLYITREAQEVLEHKVTLLHCTSDYPAKLSELNLKAMATMAKTFGLPVGYSDHSEGVVIAHAACALGATVIEKHFTLSRELEGPDHKASLEPSELTEMVSGIRSIEQALGTDRKAPSANEIETRRAARKSLVAIAPIAAGEKFTEINMGVKRPGTGVSAMRFWDYLGKTANCSYEKDDLIT